MSEHPHPVPASPGAAVIPPAGADLSRRERKKLELRARVLEAAQALFDERGFGATRISEICERADVAEKTFFNHFPSKQHLLRSLATQAIEQLVSDIEAIRKEPGSTRDHLTFFFDEIARKAEERSPLHRELLTELIHAMHDGGRAPAEDAEANEDAESQHVRRIHQAFLELVCDGVEAGEISAHYDPESITETILGSFYSMMFNWAHRDGYPIAQRAAENARFLADAIAPASSTPLVAVATAAATGPASKANASKGDSDVQASR